MARTKAHEQLSVVVPRCFQCPTLGPHVRARPLEELPTGRVGPTDQRRDLGVVHVERLVQQEDGSLRRCQLLQQHEEGHRDLVEVLEPADARTVEVDGLGQPIAPALLAPRPRRAQLVEAEPADRGEKKGLRRRDITLPPLPADPGFLHDVLGARQIPEHAIGEREQLPTMRFEG